MKTPDIYLLHIKDSIAKIERFVAGMNFDTFLHDEKTQSAVIREFEVIGEAITQLVKLEKALPESIPWQKIKGMRNRLLHEYWDIDFTIIWDAIQEDIPHLKDALQ